MVGASPCHPVPIRHRLGSRHTFLPICLLRPHRGLPLLHRIKAVFWWCYMHTENPLPAAEIIRVMPTDDDVDGLFAAASSNRGQDDGAPEEYGAGIVWSEFHMPTSYRQ